ncbi:MAG: single-stranded-DNA-specific exonuclease RecJ [Gammaproteobacteria bacterium]
MSRSIRHRNIPGGSVEQLPDKLHPVLRRVYAAREVPTAEIEPSLSKLIPIGRFSAAHTAAQRLVTAREKGERIVVIGDFDADGATASALAVTTLRGLGFEQVDFLVPDRFRFGYGLSPAIAEQAASLAPDLLMTVDNGVSSIEGVARANELGMRVLVTDHHLPAHERPAADVMVNPNLPEDDFPSKCLAGVGVVFYVMAALARELGERGLVDAGAAKKLVASGLDLVALGTVADLVPLDYNNRVLVAEGLRRIRAGQGRPGLQALFRAAGRDPLQASSSDLGFGVAPRLNAAGRLDDMSVGINCLLADSLSVAQPLATQLDQLNQERRDLQVRMESEAREHLAAAQAQVAREHADAYCLFDPAWHEGVVGLVANRIKDQANRPVVAFAQSDEPGFLKGSARSVAGVHIRDAIDAVAAREPGLIVRFGGHAMAAGLTLREADLDRFRDALRAELAAHRDMLEQPNVIWSDGELAESDWGLDLARDLAAAGPWGQGFPEPQFDSALEVVESRVLKEKHLKMTVRHLEGGAPIDAIAFNQPKLPPGDNLRFVYRLEVNRYRGLEQPQLVVEHMQAEV